MGEFEDGQEEDRLRQKKEILSSMLAEVDGIIAKWVAAQRDLATEKRRGVQTGIDEAIHETTLRLTLEAFKHDGRLTKALSDFVVESLEAEFIRGYVEVTRPAADPAKGAEPSKGDQA